MSEVRESAMNSSGAIRGRVLIVVPALNEAHTIAAVVAGVVQHAPTADVLVVDDHSGDDTGVRALAAGATVVRLPFTLGVGGAMRTGYSFALRHGYQYVVQVDGDGQHDPRHLPALLSGLEHADVVIGARFAGAGSYDVSRSRRLVMAVLARVLSAIVGVPLTDVTSGFRACGPRAVEVFSMNYPSEYLGDTLEALVIAERCGLAIRQVPVRMSAREHGKPSQGAIGSVLYLSRALAAICLGLVRRWPCPAQGSTP